MTNCREAEENETFILKVENMEEILKLYEN